MRPAEGGRRRKAVWLSAVGGSGGSAGGSGWRFLLLGGVIATSCSGLLSLAFGAPALLRPKTRTASARAFVLVKGGSDGKDLRLPRCGMQAWDDSPPPPPPRPPRERKMTDVEKQADAIVHAVVAVELLHWHGKLGGTLENAFRKCVYVPVLPRLRRLTSRDESSEDFKIDKSGRKLTRPSRVHDATLEKQFTLGYAFTDVALRALNRGHKAVWFPLAQYKSRQELITADSIATEDPQAKDLVAFSQGFVRNDKGEDIVQVRERAVGHGDAKQNIWILPVFVDHDRSSHAERQAMLVLLEASPMDSVTEGVPTKVTGQMRVYASHTPCISCLSSMCQFTRCFEGAGIKVTFDAWKETRRWIGQDAPDDIAVVDEEE
eukprot:CAMPEP_0115082858 /NCGR_PEP_ID=MMETSP0227-20121206/20168_1 /TAXON_ID=89957 /ORGANISM="Polarella glacialis, Strain CCMP 1383" /LENGTH=375 /DNA_ID=CAMNT_0002471061 /DNA_START=132 /DNA_END=1259 /DNA_ORIENTATION=-